MELGFMTPATRQLPIQLTELANSDGFKWDRQTVVVSASGDNTKLLRQHFRQFHKPQATSHGTAYDIDVFVNLNYDMYERDPAKRCIRIVYADSDILSIEEISKRFPNSYILITETGKEVYQDGTPRISGAVPQIPCR